jgi:hypothetical protein
MRSNTENDHLRENLLCPIHQSIETEDEEDDYAQTPIFIRQGVLVGFWYSDATGKGRKPVYCLVNERFAFAYLQDGEFFLVRWIDFDPLDVLGQWMGDDTDYDDVDTPIMTPKEIKEWVELMWYSRAYCGIETLGA